MAQLGSQVSFDQVAPVLGNPAPFHNLSDLRSLCILAIYHYQGKTNHSFQFTHYALFSASFSGLLH
jgi:hypothetical protein